MKRLVLLRHGQSQWNKENRFTGWVDVSLSEKGITEAREAGKVLKENGFDFKIAYTSYLKRAIKTLWLALEEMDMMWLEVIKTGDLMKSIMVCCKALIKLKLLKNMVPIK